MKFRAIAASAALMALLTGAYSNEKKAGVPSWLNEFQLLVYGSPSLDYMRTLGATATTWGIFFAGVNDKDVAYLKTLREEGFRVFANFSTMQGYESLDPEAGIEERTACLTLSGEKAAFFWSSEKPQPYILCNNNPEWAARLHSRIRESVLAGASGIHIDEVEGIAGFLFAAGFCPHCMEAFREHLRENFPDAKERYERFGIKDLDTFDYGAYLRSLGVPLQQDPNKNLRREYVIFQLLSRRRQIESLVRLAKQTGDTDVAVSANTTFLSPHKQIFMPFLDLAVYEAFMTPPPEGRYLSMHIWARGIDPAKRFVIFPVSTNMLGFSAEDWPVIAFWMLEALAGGQSFLVPFDAYTGYGPRFTIPAKPLAPVGAYLRSFAGRFPEPQPVADVGVLYDFATGIDQYIESGFTLPVAPIRVDQVLLVIGGALQKAHIPYEVIYTGDRRFVTKVPTLADLRRFSVIVLPKSPMLVEETRHNLDAYRKAGGTVVDVGDPLTPDAIAKIVSSALPSHLMKTSAGQGIAIVPWRSGDSLLFHFLNYSFNRSTRSFSPVDKLDVWLRLPPEFNLTGGRLTVESPWDTGQSIPFEIVKGELHFTLPSLSSYALAVFEQTPKGKDAL